jgi:hypothetical protein
LHLTLRQSPSTKREKMVRTHKLYSRLADLERQYGSLVREEFLLEAERDCSLFLSDWLRSLTAPKDAPARIRYDQLAHLAREIQTLRSKLGETIPGPVQSIVNQFMETFDRLGTKQTPSERVALAKRAIEQLEALGQIDAAK